MTKRRKVIELTVQVSAPAWLTKAQAKREVRAIFQGYPGDLSWHGENYLDDVGTGNGLRARKVS